MKSCFFLMLLLVGFQLEAQVVEKLSLDDEIAFQRVENQIKIENYKDALKILENISESGKNNKLYLPKIALCNDKLNYYDNAILYYKQLYSKTNSLEYVKKIAEMEDKKAEKLAKEAEKLAKEEYRRNCKKCNGTGFYNQSVRVDCNFCDGDGLRDCYYCRGTRYYPDGVLCKKCSGDGYQICYECDKNHKVDGLKSVKCYLHD